MIFNIKKNKFDGLAKKYDLYRPRYPIIFFKEINHWIIDKKKLNILDIGSGTGIALEGLIKILGKKNNFFAIDLSQDMINIGKTKYPYVKWIKGKAEHKIKYLPKMDIIISAQSFQWMNRIKLLKLIKKKLNLNGIFCILQNNRNYKINDFLNKYENILEKINSQYSRKYRKFKYKKEIKLIFNNKYRIYIYLNYLWTDYLTKQEFIGMSYSSTQVQQVKNINNYLFKKKINNLITQYSNKNKAIKIDFKSELFLVKNYDK